MVIAFVDDNPHERAYISSLIMNEFEKTDIPIKQIHFFENAEDFLNNHELNQYDLIILDIFMNEISGIELAYKIRKQNPYVRIVFCSTSNDFACESYNVGASFYIQKPVKAENIKKMIERLNIEDYELRRFIELPDKQQIFVREIMYAEYSKHVITIHKKLSKDIKTRLSLNAFTELIKEFSFLISCNQGTIINLYEVKEWTDECFTMKDGTVISISRRKRKVVENAYTHFLFSLTRKEL